MNYEITFEIDASTDDLQVISDGLEATVLPLFPDKSRTSVAFFVRDDSGKIVGGVNGNYGSFGWLYVNALWVDDRLRRQGLGSELMNRIEAEAIKHDCKNVFLNTMSFQAPEFYKKLGYTTFAELEDFPAGHSRIFLRKKLA